MMGMHGEAWVNMAIQEADLLIALGMRFDDRVTGTLKTYAPLAKKIHVEIDPSEINKNVPVDIALVDDLKRTVERLLLARPGESTPEVAQPHPRRSAANPPCATFRICPMTAISTPRTSSTICGARLRETPSWSPTWASTRCGRRSITGTSARAR